jgi:hypothetical protein
MLARDVAALLVDIRCTIHEMETNYVPSEQDGAKSLIDHTSAPFKEQCDVMTEIRELEGNIQFRTFCPLVCCLRT